MTEELQQWENEGGFSPPVTDTHCVQCGDDRAPRLREANGNWRCLVHLGKLGGRREWRDAS